MLNLIIETINYVAGTLIHNAPVLALSILIAATITVYADPEKLKEKLMKRANISITGSVAFGALTPFCACGTMAVIVSMLTTALPWGPVMAFLTSSPLMSPNDFIMISGFISIKFAVALTAASLIIGIASGYITYFIEKNTKFLVNQARFADVAALSFCTARPAAESSAACGCGSNRAVETGCCFQNNTSAKNMGFAEKFRLK